MIENNNISREAELSKVIIEGESFYKISNSDSMRPFFMSIVSESDHWMFISSNGGLSAGRKNAEYSIFPYYTDDKITESVEVTGSKSIFKIQKANKSFIWEPFSERFDGMYRVTRNLYKNIYGNKVLFEEINHDLDLTFKYQWNSSDRFGFVRKSFLSNQGEQETDITILDGIQNILPYGVGSYTQNNTSNLVDAYKRSELVHSARIGIFALSAIIVDKAEPSEALKANIAWSLGLQKPKVLLSSLQLKKFRKGLQIHEERDIKAEKGAYFLHAELSLSAHEEREWKIVANVNQTQADILEIQELIKNDQQALEDSLIQDIQLGTKKLIEINASADGLQMTADQFKDSRHFSNTLFNIMRGGIFDDNYNIEKWDFSQYVEKANNKSFEINNDLIDQLPETFSQARLLKLASKSQDPNFKRLCLEYLPLKFSRRHGDPSRPWNKFSINTRSEVDGSKILDYEGNWRDIFQNWEALALSYPLFLESMMHKFLNASTFDGYNPYRVTKDGFDWEIIEPDDPWSYIGYWGDHQIIYLLKFLELIQKHNPGQLESYFDQEIFVYANVPYKIKSYEDILKNPKDTIEFDVEGDEVIRHKRAAIGADGALLEDANGSIYHTNFLEKIMATLLSKMSNFIPEGGIWMNTQRPEWNDANNALVGNGVSMVTLYYLRRFLKFFEELFEQSEINECKISVELAEFFSDVHKTLKQSLPILSGIISDADRKLIVDQLGKAGSNYRNRIYEHSFSGEKCIISLQDLKDFTSVSVQHLEHSIDKNKRPDNLYHAYNLLTIEDNDEISISYLSEMLEGQVAVLSSGFLSSNEALKVLDGLKSSKLFREDQYSYLLYPNKDLPGFMEKNDIPAEAVEKSNLLSKLISDGNQSIIEKDLKGGFHFNGNFRNANDLAESLNALSETEYAGLVEEEKTQVLDIFEEIFNHKAFTGRSGTFYGYEGLGSIYWHMVSKLLLAVQECCLKAIRENEDESVKGRLLEHYYEINEGIGVHKSPSLYGAFPTDPYSHTPSGKGAQQPGMTGQVKEDILCRFGELGVFVINGKLFFRPGLLRRTEFLKAPGTFKYINVYQEQKEIQMSEGALAFTYCQVPIIYSLSDHNSIEIIYNNGENLEIDGLGLNKASSDELFERTGKITQINVYLNPDLLR
ncbi:MAG: hypothetical protein HKN68_17115 [Saprospiraceae bacterium]|nr:hypothetical protein [Saprospiraceae bacterium]